MEDFTIRATSSTKKPHVALLPSPGMGHLTPVFEFAKRLVINHDFHVSFLVIASESSAAQDNLLRSPTVPSGLHVVDLPWVETSHVITQDMTILARLCHIIHESLDRSLRSILVQLNRPKALIIDLFCTQAFDICRELSIPVFSFFTASTGLLSFSLYLPTLDREVEGEFVDLPEPVQVPGCRAILTDDLLDQVKNRKLDEYKWYLLHMSRLVEASGIIENSWEDLEPVSLKALRANRFFQEIHTPPVFPIGPIIKQDGPVTKLDKSVLSWLDKQPADSVLFITLGSGGTLSSEQLTELTQGLELSQQRFILVARRPTDKNVAASFFNAGNYDENNPQVHLPKGFIDRTQGIGLVVREWAPQVAVLRHVATGGFLSHCGWNSTLESLVHGVPMIAWPLYAEQRMNAATLIKEMGVAVKPMAEPGEGVIRREEIARVVRLLMGGEQGKTMRLRARELQESAMKALNSGGSSFESLSRLVQEILK